MEKVYVPVNIPTVQPTTLMEEVRLRTINPMIGVTERLGQALLSLDSTVTSQADTVSDLDRVVTSHADKISNLEAGPTIKEITKWYVLPLAGQSNMWGCGEAPWDINCINDRIKQLGVMDSDPDEDSSVTNLNIDTCPYGSRYKEFRPMVDSNLKMIPSVPALDSAANGFHLGYKTPVSGGVPTGTHIWGNTGLGHYLASAILPYLPQDFGILIVNASRPGGGLTSDAGSYDEVTMRPSSNANGHGVDLPFNRMLKDRVKYALEMNPENKLLPLIWMQGESDNDPKVHYEEFKNLILNWKQHLETNNFSGRLPNGNIENMKVFCLGTTKVIYGSDNGFDYLSEMYHSKFKHAYRSRYDNYAYLMDHPDFKNPTTGEGYVTYVRVDIDEFGDFIETAMEENRANGYSKVFSSVLDTHFSSKALQNKIPRLVLNAIGGSKTAYLVSPIHNRWSRYIPGRQGVVSTDNVRYEYPKTVDSSFDPESGLLAKKNYQTGNHYVSSDVTVILDSEVTVGTEDTSSFGEYRGLSGKGWAGQCVHSGNATLSLMFRLKDNNRTDDTHVIGSCSKVNGVTLHSVHGQLYFIPKTTISKSVCLNKSSFGAWEGTWEDWQHVTATYNANLNQTDVYLNGCLIHTLVDTELRVENMCIGSQNGNAKRATCDIKYFRAYNKCLSAGEAGALYVLDVFGNGENTNSTKSDLEKKVDDLQAEIEALKAIVIP